LDITWASFKPHDWLICRYVHTSDTKYSNTDDTAILCTNVNNAKNAAQSIFVPLLKQLTLTKIMKVITTNNKQISENSQKFKTPSRRKNAVIQINLILSDLINSFMHRSAAQQCSWC